MVVMNHSSILLKEILNVGMLSKLISMKYSNDVLKQDRILKSIDNKKSDEKNQKATLYVNES